MPPKLVTRSTQARPEFVGVVDLAVVDNHPTAIRRCHRLMAGGREIDHREPPMAEPKPGAFIGPYTAVVRTPVFQLISHRPGDLHQIIF